MRGGGRSSAVASLIHGSVAVASVVHFGIGLEIDVACLDSMQVKAAGGTHPEGRC